MSVRVLSIAGVPASGKTTLLWRLRSRIMSEATVFAHGELRGIEQDGVKMFGVFDGSAFEGTDRLSMSAINDAIAYIYGLSRQPGKFVVLVEGDRLFCHRFLHAVKPQVILLDASEAVLEKRHMERGDQHTPQHMKAKRTKIERMASRYKFTRLVNNTPADSERIAVGIEKLISSWLR